MWGMVKMVGCGEFIIGEDIISVLLWSA